MRTTTAALSIDKLGDILVRDGLITADQLKRALAEQRSSGMRLGYTLVKLGFIEETEITKMLARQYRMPAVDLSRFEVDPKILKLISPDIAAKYTVLPLKREGRTLTIAIADPNNVAAIEDIKFITRCDIFPVIAGEYTLRNAIDRYYQQSDAQLQSLLKSVEDEGVGDLELLEEQMDEEVKASELAEDAPVVKLINGLLTDAVKREASDIHIEPFEDTLRIRYRVDGILYEQEAPPRRLQAAVTSRIKIMAEMNIAERRLPQDGRIRVTAPGGRRVDIRVSTVPTIHGESIVMRLLDRSSVFLPFDRLGFAPAAARGFEALIHRPHGIVLVTGPTGSGKTTTLYAALDKINRPDLKIITVEDPVEYQLKGVNQIPVRPKIGLSFASGLRHIVRQDPDVIMVGEIRDLETAEIAIQAALTGHLVFSTLHTNDAPGAVTRLQDMGCEPYLVSSVLSGVLAQRLVRRICEACRVPDHPDPASLLALGVTDAAGVELFHGKGCDDCRGTGYRGRTGIYELFRITEDSRSLVVRKAPVGEIRRHAVAQGMVTLREDAWAKACAGLSTVEEILRVTQEDT